MSKSLGEMTNEELWQLFPIILEEHNPAWKERYIEEKSILEKVIGKSNIKQIDHIGSTSIPNIIAKPTVDILLQINDDTDIEQLFNNMDAAGYECNKIPKNPAPHLTFLKGYTQRGFEGQVFHIHVRYSGDWDELYFRDYLIKHPDVADEYGKLKLELKPQFEHDRDGYTYAKTDFVKKINCLARQELQNK
ncbi:MAG: GrpB family protein [Bacillota bacterium]